MLFFILGIFAMLVLFDRATRQGRLELLRAETSYKLFALRDELRQSVISDNPPDDNWFDCLDTTITRNIHGLKTLTIWELAGLIYKHHGDAQIDRAYGMMTRELSKPANKELKSIFISFVTIANDFLMDRHRSLRRGGQAAAALTNLVQSKFNALKESTSRILVSAPETSTLLRHCQNL